MIAMTRRYALVGVAAAAFGLAFTAPSVHAQAPDAVARESTVTASGTARVSRAPDFVDVVVGVVAHETTASAAQATADKVMSAAVSAIKALNLAKAELQTGTVELSPRYERRDHDGEPTKIIGYVASMTLRVRTADLAAVARITDTALAAGCNRVDSVQFGVQEALAAREEAIRLATRAARRKAEVLAESLDMRLGRLITANTTSNQWGGWYGANRMSQMANTVEGGGGGEGQDAVVPGKVEVWADTNVTFAIVPK